MPDGSVEVAVIGSGIAGMSAAFRLAQRGYKVTVFEQDSFPGGQFRAIAMPGHPNVFHEHCYHLFEGWYHNFWNLVRELGLQDRFAERDSVKYLARNEFPKMTELKGFVSLADYLSNLRSGTLSIPDMYLFLYSFVDLLASPIERQYDHDITSVSDFLHSKPYATDASVNMHSNVLFKAFGVPTFDSSVHSYRKFVGLGAITPPPMGYLMKGNVYQNFWQPLESAFAKLGGVIQFNTRLEKIDLDANGEVKQLRFSRVSHSPTLFAKDRITREELPPYPVTGSVILAVPPIALSELCTEEVYFREPQWGRVAKLRTDPMASVHLHFNQKFVERLKQYNMTALPKEPVILLDSRYCLTFLDNSNAWNLPAPYLHVVASDFKELSRIAADNQDPFTYQGRALANSGDGPLGLLNLQNPKSPIEHILAELARYVPFTPDEIDFECLEIDSNIHYPIFINEIGSWPDRPTVMTPIANLFRAGSHCQTDIDMTTIEGAVLSGLEAAEAVRRRHGAGEPVNIVYPKMLPFYAYTPFQVMGAPWAVAAKVCSDLNDIRHRAEAAGGVVPFLRQTSSRELADFAVKLVSAPFTIGADLMSKLFSALPR